MKAPVRLTVGARADLAWWKCFLHRWNGSLFFPLPNPSDHVYYDASGHMDMVQLWSQWGISKLNGQVDGKE